MTNEPPTEDLIRYDVMVQEALLGVVRKVLVDAARVGLPGEHHFYITFRSQAPGVRISNRLKEKYPDEMTIVLQHQFWELIVGDHGFEVGLSFGGVPEKLVVPYEALTGFYDPSVQFGLKFTPDEAQADNDLGDEVEEPSVKDQLDAITTLEKTGKGKKARGDQARGDQAKAEALADSTTQNNSDATPQPAKKPRGKPVISGDESDVVPAGEKSGGGAEVVSLEAFRKKK
ncbi:MAG: hypothetical protein FD175_103 [Beijerinckiaceae bacterium]|nr:MAG: hypothetical protein FD175_103 [Beijerinckiaceae bacterium]